MLARVFKRRAGMKQEVLSMAISSQVEKFVNEGLGVNAAEWVAPRLWQETSSILKAGGSGSSGGAKTK
eukprot:3011309-Pyramimonas_sp.AAC.1